MSAPMCLQNVFVREIERNDGNVIRIAQSEIGDVGCVVWDAAIVLAKYLETEDFDSGTKWKDKKVVELGSGTGVVGLMAASLGAKVVVTDLPEFVPLMQMNIDNNRHLCRDVLARQLTWGEQKLDHDEYSNIDILLLADCIYYEASLEPLVETVERLCSPDTCVYCCYEERLTGNKPQLQRKFFTLVKERFTVDEIPLDRQDSHFCSDDIHIFKFTRLKKS